MADVHEVYIDKRRSRAGTIIGLTLVILLLIALVVAMIMNIHGSISWPAGELKFGFWPQATTSEAPTRVASDVTVVIPESDAQAVEDASESAPSSETQQSSPPAPAETEPAPAQ